MEVLQSVQNLYDRIEAVLARTPHPRRRPEASSPSGWLGLGATPEAVERFEAAAGYPLPEDSRSWYLLCDGTMGPVAPFGDRLGFTDVLLSLDSIPNEWEVFRERVESRGWIPFAGEGTGDNLCMDLAPPPGQPVGRIFDHGHEENIVLVFFPSFAAYLEQWAVDLELGRLAYDAMRDKWLYDDRVASFRGENPGRFDSPV